jgi:hypothetical protein
MRAGYQLYGRHFPDRIETRTAQSSLRSGNTRELALDERLVRVAGTADPTATRDRRPD